ncbi:MAG: PspA/IM30 family protein [Methanocella sp. PtaU1.Bin125]|nr:MAG: PspA/IM30 family protein [Methanocella sp. PtaU1.Bin125]
MGLISRMGAMIEARVSMLIDGFQSPGEALDYSYRRQLDLSYKIKKGIAGVVTAKRRLEMQRKSLEDDVKRLDRDARDAMAAGRENLAEIAIQHKVEKSGQIRSLGEQIDALKSEQERLIEMSRKLESRIETFRTRKESIKAQYSAAEAKVRIKEATSGLGKELDYIGYAVRLAEDKTRDMQARSEALDELEEQGAIEDIAGSRDVVERELTKVRGEEAVKAEMEKLRTSAKQ